MDSFDIIQFNFNNYNIRIKDMDGEIWWIAKDVCDILDIQNISQAIKALDDDEKSTCEIYVRRGKQKCITINESGLYSLILRSRKPEAKEFKKWITSEVLPSIRKHGKYEIADRRSISKNTRNYFTDLLKENGCTKPFQYAQITNQIKKKLNIPLNKKKKEFNDYEISLVTAVEALISAQFAQHKPKGFYECQQIVADATANIENIVQNGNVSPDLVSM